MNSKYDTAVIGGGAAGMFASGFAALNNHKTILIEKNSSLGKKLLITGKGRCNITNACKDLHEFIAQFGKNGKFLYQALGVFGIKDTIDFFEKQGLKLKTERGQRVFPKSDRSEDVLKVLMKFLKQNKVEILLNSGVKKIIHNKKQIKAIVLHNGKEIVSDKYIIATGGLSYPGTGSTGDGYGWAEELGHTIIDPKPALAPILVKEPWIGDLQGLSLRNVKISVFCGKKKDERFGEALFTHEGLSGPVILDMSKNIESLLDAGRVEVVIDFKPALDHKKLDLRILRDFAKYSNKNFKNILDDLLPQKLQPVIIKLSKIDPDKKANNITKEERKRIVSLLKEFKLTVLDIDGFNKAIITSGGISLKEIEPKTMKSKIIDNLYFAGEILDLDAKTGGFNLQECWSTGYVAGVSI